MRLSYFGERGCMSRIAALDWRDSEIETAKQVVGRLEGRWDMEIFELVALITVENRKQYHELKREYKEIKASLRG